MHILYTDGASRGNPGPAGAGWVIVDSDGNVVSRGNAFLGRKTNNEAEYQAVILGLDAALGLHTKSLLLRADSELLVRQLTGVYKVRNPRIAKLYREVRQRVSQFERFRVEHVRREYNRDADAQANLAVDEAI